MGVLGHRRTDSLGRSQGLLLLEGMESGVRGCSHWLLNQSRVDPHPTQRLQDLVPAQRPVMLGTGGDEERGAGHRLLLFHKCQSSRSTL